MQILVTLLKSLEVVWNSILTLYVVNIRLFKLETDEIASMWKNQRQLGEFCLSLGKASVIFMSVGMMSMP